MNYILKTLLFAGTIASTAIAQHAGDILLSVDGGRIVTGAIRLDQTFDPDVRVFDATLGEVAPNFTSDPGFDSSPATFPVGSRTGFNLLDALRVWGGSDFNSVSPSTMSVSFATLYRESPPSQQVVNGFTLAVGSNGQWHRHLEYELLAPADIGIYLLQMQLYSTAAAIAPSEPIWIVFNQGASSEEVERAKEWVRSTYLNQNPCPADFNADGGVDGSDVEAFFLAWAAAEPSADVNLDGGVDGQDVEAFFTAWARGGC